MQRYAIHNFGEGKLKNLGELQKYNFIDVMGFDSSQMENKEKLGETDRLGEGNLFLPLVLNRIATIRIYFVIAQIPSPSQNIDTVTESLSRVLVR